MTPYSELVRGKMSLFRLESAANWLTLVMQLLQHVKCAVPSRLHLLNQFEWRSAHQALHLHQFVSGLVARSKQSDDFSSFTPDSRYLIKGFFTIRLSVCAK